jgi:hypothetical protein
MPTINIHHTNMHSSSAETGFAESASIDPHITHQWIVGIDVIPVLKWAD